MTKIRFFKQHIYFQIFFWSVYFFLMVLGGAYYYPSIKEVIITNSGKVALMIISYLFFKKYLIPFAYNKKILLLIISTALFLYFLSIGNIAWRVFVLQAKFPKTYTNQLYSFDFSYINRFDWIFGVYPFYFFKPALILTLFDYIRNTKKLTEFEKEKTNSELKALKNQLNPHFLFNTLNNIYTLSLEKSTKTSDSILKLSDILDYMLYRTQEKYVYIQGEIDLIEHYIYLEQLRYGDERVKIVFDKTIQNNVKIAPLLMLNYVENAFKHGVSNDDKQSFVFIEISSDNDMVHLSIKNSIPKTIPIYNEHPKDANIGLINAKKQLDILYPDEHELHIEQTEQIYFLSLKVKSK